MKSQYQLTVGHEKYEMMMMISSNISLWTKFLSL